MRKKNTKRSSGGRAMECHLACNVSWEWNFSWREEKKAPLQIRSVGLECLGLGAARACLLGGPPAENIACCASRVSKGWDRIFPVFLRIGTG